MNGNRLDIVKRVIRENIEDAPCGIFFSHNIVGDSMVNLYADEELIIDICYDYAYFEVFGLDENERTIVVDFYDSSRRWVEVTSDEQPTIEPKLRSEDEVMTKVICNFTGCNYNSNFADGKGCFCTKDEIYLDHDTNVYCGCDDAEWDEDSERYKAWLEERSE